MGLSTLSTSVALNIILGFPANGNSSTQYTFIKKKDDLLKPHIFVETDRLWQNLFWNNLLCVANKSSLGTDWFLAGCGSIDLKLLSERCHLSWGCAGMMAVSNPMSSPIGEILKIHSYISRLDIGEKVKLEELQSDCRHDKRDQDVLWFTSVFGQ